MTKNKHSLYNYQKNQKGIVSFYFIAFVFIFLTFFSFSFAYFHRLKTDYDIKRDFVNATAFLTTIESFNKGNLTDQELINLLDIKVKPYLISKFSNTDPSFNDSKKVINPTNSQPKYEVCLRYNYRPLLVVFGFNNNKPYPTPPFCVAIAAPKINKIKGSFKNAIIVGMDTHLLEVRNFKTTDNTTVNIPLVTLMPSFVDKFIQAIKDSSESEDKHRFAFIPAYSFLRVIPTNTQKDLVTYKSAIGFRNMYYQDTSIVGGVASSIGSYEWNGLANGLPLGLTAYRIIDLVGLSYSNRYLSPGASQLFNTHLLETTKGSTGRKLSPMGNYFHQLVQENGQYKAYRYDSMMLFAGSNYHWAGCIMARPNAYEKIVTTPLVGFAGHNNPSSANKNAESVVTLGVSDLNSHYGLRLSYGNYWYDIQTNDPNILNKARLEIVDNMDSYSGRVDTDQYSHLYVPAFFPSIENPKSRITPRGSSIDIDSLMSPNDPSLQSYANMDPFAPYFYNYWVPRVYFNVQLFGANKTVLDFGNYMRFSVAEVSQYYKRGGKNVQNVALSNYNQFTLYPANPVLTNLLLGGGGQPSTDPNAINDTSGFVVGPNGPCHSDSYLPIYRLPDAVPSLTLDDNKKDIVNLLNYLRELFLGLKSRNPAINQSSSKRPLLQIDYKDTSVKAVHLAHLNDRTELFFTLQGPSLISEAIAMAMNIFYYEYPDLQLANDKFEHTLGSVKPNFVEKKRLILMIDVDSQAEYINDASGNFKTFDVTGVWDDNKVVQNSDRLIASGGPKVKVYKLQNNREPLNGYNSNSEKISTYFTAFGLDPYPVKRRMEVICANYKSVVGVDEIMVINTGNKNANTANNTKIVVDLLKLCGESRMIIATANMVDMIKVKKDFYDYGKMNNDSLDILQPNSFTRYGVHAINIDDLIKR